MAVTPVPQVTDGASYAGGGQIVPVAAVGTAAVAATAEGKERPLSTNLNGWMRATLQSAVVDAAAWVGGTLNTVAVRATAATVSYAEGTWRSLSVTLAGALRVTLAELLAGENQTTNRMMTESPMVPYRMTTATTTTQVTGAGTFGGVNIGKGVAGGTIVVYDNTAASGIVIASWLCVAAEQGFIPGDISFATGLTTITSQATDIVIRARSN